MPTRSTFAASREIRTSPDTLLDFDYPPLADDAAICIGVTIDWRRQDVLLSYAKQHTLPDEHARAARFLLPEDRLRNLIGRALLRRFAAHYGGMDERQVIRSNTWGKPEPVGCSVGCNVSHSGAQVWVAISRHMHVGIDIESADGQQEWPDIAAAFHPDEIIALRTTPGCRLAALRCWSRKEAVSKATGMGLSLPLRAYAVECGTRPAGWLRIPPPLTMRGEWTTIDLPVGKEYVGALAVRGRCEQVDVLRVRTFP